MILTCTKDFPWKKWPIFARFCFKKVFRSSYVYDRFQYTKNIEESYFFFTFILVCSQIWLNCLMDDHHFNYITKLKKNPIPTYSQCHKLITRNKVFRGKNPIFGQTLNRCKQTSSRWNKFQFDEIVFNLRRQIFNYSYKKI